MFDLDEAQGAAVHHGDGPLLVLAGAGSGKTRVLAARVGHLLDRGVAPERICLLTFSRRASAEMLSRVGPRAERVWGGTFHAVGNRFLRRHGSLVGLDPAFTVLDAGDATELVGLVRTALGLAAERRPGGRRFPSADTIASIASRVVNAQERLSDVVARHAPWCRDEVDAIRDVLVAVTERKRAQHVLDLDDLLLFWRALARAPEAAGVVAGAFDHVLVDEYQDTNALQADILDALCPDGRGLTVVGDDAQAIYGFRAATPRNILDFASLHPGTTVVTLAANHRSTPPIIGAANAVMAAAAPGHASGKVLTAVRPGARRPLLRTCYDEAAQAAAVCDAVLGHRDEGVDLRQQAVLFRAGWHADLLELELTRRNVPYVKYGGLRFLEAAHVKDLLALLRLLDNPWDELAWARALRLLDGVGPTTAARLVEALGVRAQADPSAASPLAQLLAAAPAVPAAARAALDELRTALGDCVALGTEPAPQVERLRRFLEPIVRASLRQRRRPVGGPRPGGGVRRAATAPGRPCSPTSPSTHRSPPATWPVRPGSTRSGSRSRRCTRPRAASGTSCTSSTSPTVASRPTCPPGRWRSWRRSGASCTWRAPAPATCSSPRTPKTKSADNMVVRLARKLLHTSEHYDGDKLFTIENGGGS